MKFMKSIGLIIISVFSPFLLVILPVKATHKEVNGCGDNSGLGRFVPNQPTGVDFRPVCDNHDRCYGILGQSRKDCDNNFRSGLRAKCEKELLRKTGGVLGTILTGGQALTSCYGVAESYYQAVRNRGGSAYSTAQNHAKEEQQSIARVVSPPISSSSSSIINGINFTSELIGNAVGNGGVILRTGDGGASWVRGQSGVSTNLNSVNFTSELIGNAVGNGGVILRTGDGGASWVRGQSGVSTNLNSVNFTSELIGNAVGNGGVILRTGDGGASWVRGQSGVSTNLNSVNFTSELIGNAVGDGGVILRTGDGGASWVRGNK
jgi:Photosynthesis system II assembly factor YCF48